jgi:S1-C subfamily serine protease
VWTAVAGCVPSTPTHPHSSPWPQRLSGRAADANRAADADLLNAWTSDPSDSLQARVAAMQALPAVVDIHVGTARLATTAPAHGAARDAARPSTGSGVVIGSDGLILTNEHVIRNARVITVSMDDGTSHPVIRTVVHPLLDLAILKINAGDLPALRMADQEPQRGDLVVAIGGPSFRESDPVRHGVITHMEVSLQRALDRQRTRLYEHLMESTTRIEPGFSGGALLNTEGDLIGLNVAVSGHPESAQCRGYAIVLRVDIQEAVEALLQQISTESPGE